MSSKVLVTIVLFCFNSYLFAQDSNFIVPDHGVNISLTKFIIDMEKKGGVQFFYLPEWTDNIIIRTSFKGQPIKTVLENLLKGRGIEIDFVYGYGVTLLKDTSAYKIRQGILSKLEKKLPTYIFGDSINPNWGEQVTFRGKLTNENFTEPIIGATVYANEVQKGSITNKDGAFDLLLPVGEHLITIQSQNYITENLQIKLYGEGNLDLILKENPFLLDEIIVQDNAARESFDNTLAGAMRITAKEIQTIPATMGEVDVIKSVQILPGVNSVGEGSAGYNVRGGSADQNLILLDNGIIFNPNHLFGFFSAFHPDAISDVTFYRGTIPVQYGGRISSVLDVKQKDGNVTGFKGSGGLGLITSRLMVEGPIVKDKLSFLFAGRTSYSDWILKSIKDDEVRNSSTLFYDFTAKISAFQGEDSKISASIYASKDRFKFADDTIYHWQNSSISINQEKKINQQWSLFNSLSVGKYTYEVRDEDPDESFVWDYGINNFQLKSFVTWKKNNHLFTAGVDFSGFEFKRGKLEPLSEESIIDPLELENDRSLISAAFLSDDIKIGKLSIIPGIRFSIFHSFGPGNSYVYNSGVKLDNSEIIDTIRYVSGDVIKTYHGFEPRLAAKYDINNDNFIKLSASRSYQYIHLISNTTTVTPVDSWVPSSAHLKPQIGLQYSIGFFRKINQASLTASVEVFYKRIKNVPEYKNGAELALKQNIETELVESRADIKGLEFSLVKEGRLSGQFNYTYSSSRRQTTTSFESLQINNNNFFPSNYDQPHNLKINANYDISKRRLLSFNFIAASGRPISAPTERFVFDNITIGNFPERNQYRIPTYHRLDVSLLVRTNHKKNKKWEGSWTLTLYNVYGRKNAYSVYFREAQERQLKTPKAYKLSVLGNILPSITYNFRIK